MGEARRNGTKLGNHANGAVILTRELRVRISPAHQRSLEGLAKVHGWASPTALAESLLMQGIEQAARGTMFAQVVRGLTVAFQMSRVA